MLPSKLRPGMVFQITAVWGYVIDMIVCVKHDDFLLSYMIAVVRIQGHKTHQNVHLDHRLYSDSVPIYEPDWSRVA